MTCRANKFICYRFSTSPDTVLHTYTHTYTYIYPQTQIDTDHSHVFLLHRGLGTGEMSAMMSNS